jgi:hypothetical protein
VTTTHAHHLPQLDDGPTIRAAVDAATSLGLSPSGAAIVRRGTTTQVRLPAADAVARVHPPGAVAQAQREVDAGWALADAGVDAARPVPGHQPVTSRRRAVTIWRWIDGTGAEATSLDLARAARRLHAATATGGSSLPALDPIGAVRALLDGLPTRSDDVELLRHTADDLAGRWADLAATDPLGAAVVHGDLHRNNVVMAPTGPVLVDLEVTGVGPPSYDVAAIAVAGRRYGAPAPEIDAALDAYGADPRSWDGFDGLCDVYELWATTWAVAGRASSPAAEEEAERRLTRWRTGGSAPWTLR